MLKQNNLPQHKYVEYLSLVTSSTISSHYKFHGLWSAVPQISHGLHNFLWLFEFPFKYSLFPVLYIFDSLASPQVSEAIHHNVSKQFSFTF